MARIKVPSGTIQKFEEVFDDLQSYEKQNVLKKFKLICTDELGIAVDVHNGVVMGNALKIDRADTGANPTKFTVQPGSGFTTSGEVVTVENAYTVDNISGATANSYWVVFAQYTEAGGNSITAMNAFLYDSGGSTPYATKYSRFTDSFAIVALHTTQAQGWEFLMNPNLVPLAILKLNAASRIESAAWSFNDASNGKTYTSVDGVVDLRPEGRILLDTALFDDTKVVMKDRSSTSSDGGAITGSIEVTDDLTVGDDVTIGGDILQTGRLFRIEETSNAQMTINFNNATTGCPLVVSNQGGSQSLTDNGGPGHVAHFFGDETRITFRDRGTETDGAGKMHIYVYDTDSPTSNSFGTLHLGGTTVNTSDGNVKYMAIDRFGRTTIAEEALLKVSHLQTATETFGIDQGMMLRHRNGLDNSIIWRREDYTKQSMKIGPVDTAGWSRGGLGFYTGDSSDSTTAPVLRLAIGKSGNVIIGDTDPNYGVYADGGNKLEVVGNMKVSQQLTVASDINASGNFTLSGGGVTTLTGELQCDGRGTFNGGVNINGPFTVSGLTAAGTFYSELGLVSTDFITLHYQDQTGVFRNKGSIHLDGLSRAIMNLNDEENKAWTKVTPSGTYIDTTDFAVGTRVHPNTTQFGSTFTLQGEAPSFVFRNTANINNFSNDEDLGNYEQDWFIGSKLSSGDSGGLAIGKFEGNNDLISYLEFGNTGNIGIAQAPVSGRKLAVNGGAVFEGVIEGHSRVSSNRFRWNKDALEQSDNDSYNAGITAQGRMTIRDTMQNTYSLAVKGQTHLYNDPSSATVLSFGTGPGDVTSEISLLDDVMTFKKGGDVFFQSGTHVSGAYLPDYYSDQGSVTNMHASALTVRSSATFNRGATFNGTTTDPTTFTGPVVISGNNASLDMNYIHAENISISGVANEEFYIGVGSLGTNGRGLKVLTEDALASNPQNIRIYDVKPMNEDIQVAKSRIVVRWNYNNIAGTGQGDEDTDTLVFLPSDGLAAFQNSKGENPNQAEFAKLKGKRLYMKQSTGTFVYTIEEVTYDTGALKLEPWFNAAGEQGLAYEGQSSAGPEHAWVVEEADYLHVNFLEVNEAGEHLPSTHQNITTEISSDYMSSNEFVQTLDLNKRWSIRMKTARGTDQSAWNEHKAGRYDPDHSDPFGTVSGQNIVDYTGAFMNQLPLLEDDGALGLTSSNFGFTATVAGWASDDDDDKNPHEFEFAYTTNETVDFNASNNTTIVHTTGRTLDIATTVSTDYAVGVRAIQNKQVVSATKTGSVTSGAGGVPPNYTNYLSSTVRCMYYILDLDTTDSDNFAIGAQDSGANIFSLQESQVYCVTPDNMNFIATPSRDYATISGMLAMEDTVLGGERMEIMSATGSNPPTPNTSYGTTFHSGYIQAGAGGSVGTFYMLNTAANGYNSNSDDGLMLNWNTNTHLAVMGGTKWTRRLAEVTVMQDIDIKQATIFVETGMRYTPSNPLIIRVYQQGNENAAGTMMVKTTYGETSQAMQVEIRAGSGPRTIIVDAWDPATTSPNNKGCIMGTLNLYGQPADDGSMGSNPIN